MNQDKLIKTPSVARSPCPTTTVGTSGSRTKDDIIQEMAQLFRSGPNMTMGKDLKFDYRNFNSINNNNTGGSGNSDSSDLANISTVIISEPSLVEIIGAATNTEEAALEDVGVAGVDSEDELERPSIPETLDISMSDGPSSDSTIQQWVSWSAGLASRELEYVTGMTLEEIGKRGVEYAKEAKESAEFDIRLARCVADDAFDQGVEYAKIAKETMTSWARAAWWFVQEAASQAAACTKDLKETTWSWIVRSWCGVAEDASFWVELAMRGCDVDVGRRRRMAKFVQKTFEAQHCCKVGLGVHCMHTNIGKLTYHKPQQLL